jgi:hypothetical protein
VPNNDLSPLTLGRLLPHKASHGPGTQGESAIRYDIGYDNELGPCDDCTTGLTDLGFTMTVGNTSFSQVDISNNGVIANFLLPASYAAESQPLEDLRIPGGVLIAPFLADVDNSTGEGQVTYGQGTAEGDPAFAVTWTNVGYYQQHTDLVNTFQIVLIDRSGGGNGGKGGQFLEFNYGSIQWDSPDAGRPLAPRVGFAETVDKGLSLEAYGSGTFGALTDDNPDTGLVNYDDAFGQGGSGILGRHVVGL